MSMSEVVPSSIVPAARVTPTGRRLVRETPSPPLCDVFTDLRFLTISSQGGVTVAGIDQPEATLHELVAADYDHVFHVVTIKVPGHKRWAAIGEQAYTPAEFQVYVGQFHNGDGSMDRDPTFQPCSGRAHALTGGANFRGYVVARFPARDAEWQPSNSPIKVRRFRRR